MQTRTHKKKDKEQKSKKKEEHTKKGVSVGGLAVGHSMELSTDAFDIQRAADQFKIRGGESAPVSSQK